MIAKHVCDCSVEESLKGTNVESTLLFTYKLILLLPVDAKHLQQYLTMALLHGISQSAVCMWCVDSA
jgi:hypothetical protein